MVCKGKTSPATVVMLGLQTHSLCHWLPGRLCQAEEDGPLLPVPCECLPAVPLYQQQLPYLTPFGICLLLCLAPSCTQPQSPAPTGQCTPVKVWGSASQCSFYRPRVTSLLPSPTVIPGCFLWPFKKSKVTGR